MVLNQSADKQNSQYDKVIKENLEVTLPTIIRDLLGLEVVLGEELPDDVQHTKERKPDALKKVTDSAGNCYILHIEFQVRNEKHLVYRMAEYNVMLMRKYNLPVLQYVIYLDEMALTMPVSFSTETHKFRYHLISITEADYRLFLKSNHPGIKMLGLLANFGKEDKYQAIKFVVNDIQSATVSDFAKARFNNQMRIFMQLRKSIEPQFHKAMESISTFYKKENDYLYRQGEEKGKEDGKVEGRAETNRLIVTNLVMKLNLTDEQIADIAEVDIAYVKTIRTELNSK